MFPLTRPFRQAAATAALFVFTVVPTIYVGITAWSIRQPSHLRDVEAEIGRRLGVHVSLDSVRYPRPGEVVYRGVVLRQEEPRGKGKAVIEVARASALRLKRGDRELTLEAEGLKLRGESPRQALAQVGSWLQHSGDSAYDRISLTAAACEVDLGAGVAPYRLREVVGDLLLEPSAPTLRASYRLVGEDSATRCETTLTRDRKVEPLKTTLSFKTMEGLPLPARVLGPLFDAPAWLGDSSRVEGALTMTQQGEKDWEAQFSGHLIDIDLATLVDRRFPEHRLSGKARLTVDSARWAERPGQGYGWLDAKGSFAAGPGVMGLGLLQALSTEMKFRKAPRLARVATAGVVDLDFRAFAFTFAMTPDGEIRVGGGLTNEYGTDVVVAGPTAPLAFAPEGASHVRGLIKTLFPVKQINHGVMVPLTEKSRMLLCLPVGPDIASKPIGGN